jgi:hypothetical protein
MVSRISKRDEIEFIKSIECEEIDVFETLLQKYTPYTISHVFLYYYEPNFYSSLMDICVKNNRPIFVKRLLEYGYNYSISYYLFNPILSYALSRDYIEIVKLLIPHTDFTEACEYAQQALLGLYYYNSSEECKTCCKEILRKCNDENIKKAISYMKNDFYTIKKEIYSQNWKH